MSRKKKKTQIQTFVSVFRSRGAHIKDARHPVYQATARLYVPSWDLEPKTARRGFNPLSAPAASRTTNMGKGDDIRQLHGVCRPRRRRQVTRNMKHSQTYGRPTVTQPGKGRKVVSVDSRSWHTPRERDLNKTNKHDKSGAVFLRSSAAASRPLQNRRDSLSPSSSPT